MVPIVGIPACARLVNGHLRHDTPGRYAAAVLGGAHAVPVMIPPIGEPELAVLDRIDGLLLPGSPSNVHPDHYGGGKSETPDHHDLERDATTLRLIPEAIGRGMPILAICRGVQELNVALGGTLFQSVHEIAGRFDHRGKGDDVEKRYAPCHIVRLSGMLADIVGANTILVNSLHRQAIEELAPGLVVEATAPDGTIEAVRLSTAHQAHHAVPWVFGVQWHPEWRYADDTASLAILHAFGEACIKHAHRLRKVG